MDDDMGDDIQATNRIFMAKLVSLEIAVRTLIRTHHNPEVMVNVANLLSEGAKSNLLPTNWTDAEIAYYDSSLQGLLSAVPRPRRPT